MVARTIKKDKGVLMMKDCLTMKDYLKIAVILFIVVATIICSVYLSIYSLSPLEAGKILLDPSYYLKTDTGLYNTVYPVKKAMMVLYKKEFDKIKTIDQQTAVLLLGSYKKLTILDAGDTLVFVTYDNTLDLYNLLAKIPKEEYEELIQMRIVRKRVFEQLNKANIDKITNKILNEEAKSMRNHIISTITFAFILSLGAVVILGLKSTDQKETAEAVSLQH
ncbi:hypothetical protein [Caldicellulosiruptor acetigenus]|nr:hypothetical protein [Caldicellulosiruptor acetigenus]